MMSNNQKGLLGMFNVFAGGAISRMAIFALGIMPYISSSIIVQLLTGTSDYFKNLKAQGETGRSKITQITRYGTVLLATVQGYGLAVGLESSANLVIRLTQSHSTQTPYASPFCCTALVRVRVRVHATFPGESNAAGEGELGMFV